MKGLLCSLFAAVVCLVLVTFVDARAGVGITGFQPQPQRQLQENTILTRLQGIATQLNTVGVNMHRQYSTIYYFIDAVSKAQKAARNSTEMRLDDILTSLAKQTSFRPGPPAVGSSVTGTQPAASRVGIGADTDEGNSRVGVPTTTTPEPKPIVTGCTDPNAIRAGSGVFTLESGARVYCDQVTAGGGWTVIQKRSDGSVNFYRDWDQYKFGFGNLATEFYYGNENIRTLTSNQRNRQTLRIDMQSFSGVFKYAEYQNFWIKPEQDAYELFFGRFRGTAADVFRNQAENRFSTFDRDNDQSNINCAQVRKSGFWFNNCGSVSLNGVYRNSTTTIGPTTVYSDGIFGSTSATGQPPSRAVHPVSPFGSNGQQRAPSANLEDNILWRHEFGTTDLLKHVQMKIRPRNFRPPSIFKGRK